MLSVNYAKAVLALALCLAVVFAGCQQKVNLAESDNPDDVTPPAAAGSVEQLQGTSWLFDGLDMVATFKGATGTESAPTIEGAEVIAPAMTVVLSNPKDPKQTMAGYWRLRPNGVISMTFLGNTKAGTWDGKTLILGGEEGVPATAGS